MSAGVRLLLVITHVLMLRNGTTAVQDNFTLNIGLIESWAPLFNQLLIEQNLTTKWKNYTLHIPNPKSHFDKMLKAKALLHKNDIHVVLGPYDDSISIVTEKVKIPYLCTTAVKKFHDSSLHIMPPLSDFSQAMYDVTTRYGFDKVSLFYDDDQGVFIMEKLLMNHDMTVKAWRIDTHSDPKLLKKQAREHLVNMRRAFVQKSIIFCNEDNTRIILDQARSLAMLSNPYVWFFFDPGDQLSYVFKQFPDVVLNFTSLSLINSTTINGYSPFPILNRLNLSLASDAVTILDSSLKRLSENMSENISSTLEFIFKNISVTGNTGNIEFDQNGSRYNYNIFLKEVEELETFQIGEWKSHPREMENRLRMSNLARSARNMSFPLKGRKVPVVMILEKPFTMKKRDADTRLGNDRFEGFAVDLITEVARMQDFDFEIYLVNDGKFGSKLPNGEWNGMIGELLAGNATMSVAPLSINSQREMAVDFTKPFMTRYISVLMRLPETESTFFEFLNPLHHTVWFCTFGAFVVVSIILYGFEKFGVGHNKDYPSITFRESFWFVFGSLLQGSTESSPNTLPGRILTSAWWFFALILISSYTANLAAFLTVKKINTPIKSVTDLASQTKIKYGTVKSSGIMAFFEQTNIDHFSKMWAHMSEIEPSSMVDSTEEGFRKVKTEDYAFFWDTTVNTYKTIEDCDFMEIGPYFDPKGFGIGVPPGAIYREDLSMAILRLSDSGYLHQLENKWWGSRNCPDFSKPTADETSALQLENVAGVFFILMGGIGCAAIACGLEHFAKVVKKASTTVSILHTLIWQ
ncbi:hypothetical protein FSP39_021745 [Pinctada imbricata]|uniref:Uncharacterized protein n=1 Tax=Pinctada imbricata TaxID=66713 RepID=A0AA88Y9G8_PINIB|nr:hypothetical protein FSP39_021745 [Pinctada imbricata]